jgi:hypothetical protein
MPKYSAGFAIPATLNARQRNVLAVRGGEQITNFSSGNANIPESSTAENRPDFSSLFGMSSSSSRWVLAS